MDGTEADRRTIVRLFHAKARKGCAAKLIEKFATTSADVVQHEPGNEGYFFGRGIAADANTVIFASFWRDLDAVKERFGAAWQSSFMPEGYGDLIEDCSVQHIAAGSGWHLRLDK